MEISINRVRHRWAEPAGFSLNRPEGSTEYILLHFLTPVKLSFNEHAQPVEKGTFIVFAPGTPHSFVADEALFHDWIHISGNVDELMRQYGLEPDTLYQPSQTAGISDIIAFLENEFFARRPYWEELSQAKFHEMLIRVSHCVNAPQLQPNVRYETAEHLREIRTRILSSPWHSWSIPELAHAVSLSQSRLHAVYKAVFGISPRRDLILIRIEKAKMLLQNGSTVSSVSEQLGYSSVYHFIRQFRQVTGTTPKQFSKNGG
ncbi:MAG: AraC family transcriptional regulator [Clostridia bacterium]|nr:AraC family transcriptional regulator [Clostridia bacterium]